MIDYVRLTGKANSSFTDWNDWESYTNTKGEACYIVKGLHGFHKFSFKPSDRKIKIWGSLHKVYNFMFNKKKNVNYNRFTINNLMDTIGFVEDFTGVDSKNLRVNRYEFGINIPFFMNTEKFLSTHVIDFLDYKNPNRPFNEKFYSLKFCKSKIDYKFYDKGKQAKLEGVKNAREILRVETVIKSHQQANRFGVKTLADLAKQEVWDENFQLLKQQVNNLIVLDQPDSYHQINNPKYWERLRRDTTGAGRKRKQREKENLPESNLKKEILGKMELIYKKLSQSSLNI